MLTDSPASNSSPLPWKAIGIGVGITIVLLVIFLVASRYQAPPSGSRQDAYAAHLAVQNARVTQADTMMAGSITYWNADLVNQGSRAVSACTVKLTFLDPYGRTVQMETVKLVPPGAPPLEPGGSRHVQAGFDHISFQWNQAPPRVDFLSVYLKK